MNKVFENILTVLVNPSHPGNIGATARAMKNMCLSNLMLVEPLRYPEQADIAFARASGAEDVLSTATKVTHLDEAIASCQLVLGASVRSRSVKWPMLDPQQAADKILATAREGYKVAILYGRENSGLTNDELSRCHYLIQIPANPDYNSLNVAMAVQVISYEILKQSESLAQESLDAVQGITAKQFESFIEHLELMMETVQFTDDRSSDKLMMRLRKLFLRAQLQEDEVQILRGIFKAIVEPRVNNKGRVDRLF